MPLIITAATLWLITLEWRLRKMAMTTTEEIAAIKTEVTTYQTNVTAKIAALEATIAAGGTLPADVQTALDDLKATADGLTLPA